MTRKTMTPERYQEIKRLLDMGLSVKKICKAMRATKRTIQVIRDNTCPPPRDGQENGPNAPLWCSQIP